MEKSTRDCAKKPKLLRENIIFVAILFKAQLEGIIAQKK